MNFSEMNYISFNTQVIINYVKEFPVIGRMIMIMKVDKTNIVIYPSDNSVVLGCVKTISIY